MKRLWIRTNTYSCKWPSYKRLSKTHFYHFQTANDHKSISRIHILFTVFSREILLKHAFLVLVTLLNKATFFLFEFFFHLNFVPFNLLIRICFIRIISFNQNIFINKICDEFHAPTFIILCFVDDNFDSAKLIKIMECLEIV